MALATPIRDQNRAVRRGYKGGVQTHFRPEGDGDQTDFRALSVSSLLATVPAFPTYFYLGEIPEFPQTPRLSMVRLFPLTDAQAQPCY